MKKQFDEKKIAKIFSETYEQKNRERKDRYGYGRNHKGENWRVIEREKTNRRNRTKNRSKRSQNPMKTHYDKW